jgi:hypothetical protein
VGGQGQAGGLLLNSVLYLFLFWRYAACPRAPRRLQRGRPRPPWTRASAAAAAKRVWIGFIVAFYLSR